MDSMRDLSAIEEHNLDQIEQLNQRGGRTLSIVDLILDGTLTAEMAALCWMALGNGSSLLTGAVPGGAGKTTLMAALMAFLPPRERIETVADREVLDRALAGRIPLPATLLAHEIGAGSWFGYIWGRDVADFLALPRRGLRVVSCLHADDEPQTARSLRSLGVAEEDLRHVGLQLFMRIAPGRSSVRRRVSTVHCRLGDALETVCFWSPATDRFEMLLEREEVCHRLAGGTGATQGNALRSEWEERERFISRLCGEGVRGYGDVRSRMLRYAGA